MRQGAVSRVEVRRGESRQGLQASVLTGRAWFCSASQGLFGLVRIG